MPKSVAEIAAYVAGEVIGDSQTVITGLASLESVRAGELVYAETERHLAHALASAATTVLVGPGIVAEGKVSIRVQNPKLAFARLLEWFEPEPRVAEGIHATAIIHPSVQLGENVAVGPYTVIEANVRLGKNCQIGAGCYLGPGVTLGDDCVPQRRNRRAGAHSCWGSDWQRRLWLHLRPGEILEVPPTRHRAPWRRRRARGQRHH